GRVRRADDLKARLSLHDAPQQLDEVALCARVKSAVDVIEQHHRGLVGVEWCGQEGERDQRAFAQLVRRTPSLRTVTHSRLDPERGHEGPLDWPVDLPDSQLSHDGDDAPQRILDLAERAVFSVTNVAEHRG